MEPVRVDWAALIEAATRARERAYAPYSRFAVGAALLADGGSIHTGANVENASYGLTICAERAAVVSAIARGARRFVALTVVTDAPTPTPPCGACRQVLREFAPNLDVLCANTSGRQLHRALAELLPDAFGPDSLAE
ncbi:MAG: cytidine deaminase [Chloroflexota bacterium]|nr:MAG: cytidine deaminase [Chloroflexota bacterium]